MVPTCEGSTVPTLMPPITPECRSGFSEETLTVKLIRPRRPNMRLGRSSLNEYEFETRTTLMSQQLSSSMFLRQSAYRHRSGLFDLYTDALLLENQRCPAVEALSDLPVVIGHRSLPLLLHPPAAGQNRDPVLHALVDPLQPLLMPKWVLYVRS